MGGTLETVYDPEQGILAAVEGPVLQTARRRRFRMNRNLIVGLIAASALFPRLSLASPFIYQNDDGTQTSRGANFLDTTRYSIQGYDVLPGAEQILGVQVRWGTGGGTDAVDLLLWIDPDNDGEFTDLAVQRTVAGPSVPPPI